MPEDKTAVDPRLVSWLMDAEIKLIPEQIEKLATTYFELKESLHAIAMMAIRVSNGSEEEDELTELAEGIMDTWFSVPGTIGAELQGGRNVQGEGEEKAGEETNS